jgi:DivIVA domain-containing protein
MALTPEDVVNKRFQSTKFREGYDQDEVDDFLDEIVVEFRRLNQENDELKQRLVAADARIAELQRNGGVSTGTESPAPLPTPVQASSAPAASAPVHSAPAAPETVMDEEAETASTHNLLQLARRLHEEHVREGMIKRDEFIADGRETAARLISQAENEKRQMLDQMTAEKESLEARVEELRVFEREYRNELRTYIQGQLRELEGTGSTLAQPGSASHGGGSAPGSAQFPGSAPAFGQPQPASGHGS